MGEIHLDPVTPNINKIYVMAQCERHGLIVWPEDIQEIGGRFYIDSMLWFEWIEAMTGE